MQERGRSERHACSLVGLPRQTCRYRPRQEQAYSDARLVERLEQIAAKHIRFGYRRAHALIGRQSGGQAVNHKRVYRLWRREGLAVPRRVKKKVSSTAPKQERPHAADRPNVVWCVDFVQDQTVTGRRLRFLSVTDEFTRESLAIEVAVSLPATTVSAVLEQVMIEHRCAPRHLRSDIIGACAGRTGVHCVGTTRLPEPRWRGDRVHRERQTVAERLRGKFPQPASGRVLEPRGVFINPGRAG